MTGTILICLYDDWTPAEILLGWIDGEFSRRGWSWRVLLVDDGSRLPRPGDFLKATRSFSAVEIMVLRRNVGHQKAIATGLCHLCATGAREAVVVMDGDGEDRPEDLVRLIEAAAAPGFSAIIFAERTRRLEGPTFRFLYLIYRLLHFVLTGYTIRFGNFSIIPGSLLEGLTVDPNLWLHYAASAVSGGVPYTTIPTSRGRRIEGRSKLGLSGLVRHGLTALCCYDRVMSVRLMVGAAVLNAAILIFVLAGALLEMYLPLALPRPLVLEGGLVGFLCADVLLAVSLGAVFLIRQRKSILTPPLQEYRGLIERIDKIR